MVHLDGPKDIYIEREREGGRERERREEREREREREMYSLHQINSITIM